MSSKRYPEESGIEAAKPATEKQEAVAEMPAEVGSSRRGPVQKLHLKKFILDKAHEAICLIGPDLAGAHGL